MVNYYFYFILFKLVSELCFQNDFVVYGE